MKATGWAWSAAVAVALAGPAWAQQRPVGAIEHKDATAQPDVVPGSYKFIDFVTGGAATASRAGTGLSDPPTPEPAWLQPFTHKLRDAVQPARMERDLGQHALAKAPLWLLRVGDAASSVPAVAAAATWPELLCPPMATRPPPVVLVRTQTLAQSEAGDYTIGVELACLVAGRQVVRSSRVIAEVGSRGQVRWAFGVRVERTLPVAGDRPTPETPLQWQVAPAPMQSLRPAWILANTHGWLAQVVLHPQAEWSDDQAMLRPEPYKEPSDKLPARAVWWFDRTGKPLAVLLQQGQQLGQHLRAPLHKEAVADFALKDQPGLFVLQRVAQTSAQGQPIRAGYVAWRLREGAAQAWQVVLPALEVEGMWLCHPTADERALACNFQAAAMHVQVQVPDCTLVRDDAGLRFAPPVGR